MTFNFLREELKYDSGYEKRQKAFHFMTICIYRSKNFGRPGSDRRCTTGPSSRPPIGWLSPFSCPNTLICSNYTRLLALPCQARITNSTEDLDDESIQGKLNFENFSLLATE
ncbi:GD15772 [Drosophila simulans]|uniref:GD15772 n=1 Tax=Drosophila simulans TaxID=7240 RepID=B4R5J5_DROSI|nr:GD15772 [Drosophila simulans]